MRRIDLKDRRFGRLTVLGYSHSHIQPSKQKRAMWDVKCDCGTIKKASTSTLTFGNTFSCGCYLRENRGRLISKPDGVASFNYKYLQYKHSAKNRGIEFNITKEEFRDLITKNCVYCKMEPKMHHVKRSRYGLFISNGIDRKDSSIGYAISNCVTCCKICNMMKNNLSEKEFIDHIRRIYYAIA